MALKATDLLSHADESKRSAHLRDDDTSQVRASHDPRRPSERLHDPGSSHGIESRGGSRALRHGRQRDGQEPSRISSKQMADGVSGEQRAAVPTRGRSAGGVLRAYAMARGVLERASDDEAAVDEDAGDAAAPQVQQTVVRAGRAARQNRDGARPQMTRSLFPEGFDVRISPGTARTGNSTEAGRSAYRGARRPSPSAEKTTQGQKIALVREKQSKRMRLKAVKDAQRAQRAASAASATKAAASTTAKAWRARYTAGGFAKIVAAGAAIFIPVMIAMTVILGVVSQAPEPDTGYVGIDLPPAVETWRDEVAQACDDLGVDGKWVDLALAMMAQESGGNLLVTCYNGLQIQDIMQACEGAYGSWIMVGAPEYGCAPRTARASIYAGVAEMRDNLSSWAAYLGEFEPWELGKVKLVVQGYNYGGGYLSWCERHGITEWSIESSRQFSSMMAAQTGWGYYGTPEHANLVMRYYPYREATGEGYALVVDAALTIANTYATPYVYGGNSITTGCDCSYFTQFCYRMAGIDIPRQSEAQRDAGTCIPISEAQPGDLLWMQGHIGIYLDENTCIEQTPPYCRVNSIGYNRWVCAVRIG